MTTFKINCTKKELLPVVQKTVQSSLTLKERQLINEKQLTMNLVQTIGEVIEYLTENYKTTSLCQVTNITNSFMKKFKIQNYVM